MARSLFRYSPLDAWLVFAAVLQAGLVGAAIVVPQTPFGFVVGALLFAIVLWWNANTVAHNHLHRPLFARHVAALNPLFAAFLTLSTGVPQRLWRKRHLWHHAGEVRSPDGSLPASLRLNRGDWIELSALGLLWLSLLLVVPRSFVFVYLPGWLIGMALCQLQGHYEHAGQPVTVEPGVSYYGTLYNLLWWNDGYHGEHHRFPGTHWSRLPRRQAATQPRQSPLPPLLRGFEPWLQRLQTASNRWLAQGLVILERLALACPPIARFMLATHARGLSVLLAQPGLQARLLRQPRPRIAIIGGGLFPRTALVLQQLLPDAQLVLIDDQADHLQQALAVLKRAGVDPDRVQCRHDRFCPQQHRDFDLVILPLGYRGDRADLYRIPCHDPPRILHAWLWQRPPTDDSPHPARVIASQRVSLWLLKQVCLVWPGDAPAVQPSQLAQTTDPPSTEAMARAV